MSRHGPSTFPLNINQHKKVSPSPFLEPGLASLETGVPLSSQRCSGLGSSRRESSAVPWGLHAPKKAHLCESSHCQTASKETQPREGWGGSRLFTVSWEWLPAPVGSAKWEQRTALFPQIQTLKGSLCNHHANEGSQPSDLTRNQREFTHSFILSSIL